MEGVRLRRYREGLVEVLAPDLDRYRVGRHLEPAWAPVFYNPRMRMSRDVGVAVVAAFARLRGLGSITVLEPLGATGVRGLRYMEEVPAVSRLILNDLNPLAYELMRANSRGARGEVLVYRADANALMHALSARGVKVDVVDLDPFGTPVPFLAPALRVLRNGGLLALTATDLPPLYGIYPVTCLRKYGARSLKTEYHREVGVRILVFHVVREAAKFGSAARPLYAHASQHYIRTYFEVRRGKGRADSLLSEGGYLVHCFRCLYRGWTRGYPLADLGDRCPRCGARVGVAGPLWLGPLWDPELAGAVVEEYSARGHLSREGLRVVRLIEGEVGSAPFYYVTDELAKRYSLPEEPSAREMVEALGDASLTHFDPKGFRTGRGLDGVLEALRRVAR